MPTISIFFGITVQMYWNGHAPPHIHAFYSGSEALFAIESGLVIGGHLPPKVERVVREWVLARQGDLVDNWRRGRSGLAFRKVPGADV
jgi:hypothetical protein